METQFSTAFNVRRRFSPSIFGESMGTILGADDNINSYYCACPLLADAPLHSPLRSVSPIANNHRDPM
jgi:hypothetical protein